MTDPGAEALIDLAAAAGRMTTLCLAVSPQPVRDFVKAEVARGGSITLVLTGLGYLDSGPRPTHCTLHLQQVTGETRTIGVVIPPGADPIQKILEGPTAPSDDGG